MLPHFYRIEYSVGLNCDQMEEGEQYSQDPMEGNSRGYMSMRDYIDQWMIAPSYMVPPQYAFLSQP